MGGGGGGGGEVFALFCFLFVWLVGVFCYKRRGQKKRAWGMKMKENVVERGRRLGGGGREENTAKGRGRGGERDKGRETPQHG